MTVDVVNQQNEKVDSLDADSLKPLVQQLLTRIDELLAQIKAQNARIAELEAKLGQPPKTPDNSSLPPSRGQKANAEPVAPKLPRKGRPGVARALADNADVTRRFYAERCGCGAVLDAAGQDLAKGFVADLGGADGGLDEEVLAEVVAELQSADRAAAEVLRRPAAAEQRDRPVLGREARQLDVAARDLGHDDLLVGRLRARLRIGRQRTQQRQQGGDECSCSHGLARRQKKKDRPTVVARYSSLRSSPRKAV